MFSKSLVLERTYQASIERVWKAITDKDQMKEWYFDVSEFRPEVGFRFRFYGENANGKKLLHLCMVTEVEPPVKLSYTWCYQGYPGQSLLTFELRAEDKRTTRLKLTHSGTDTFPYDNEDFKQSDFNQGWNDILDGPLREFVDETESLSKSIIIKAPAAVVWEVLLNPNGKWGLAFGGGAVVETSWQQGGPVTWKDMNGNIGAAGVISAREELRILRMQYYDEVEPPPGSELGRYTEEFILKADGQHTQLTLTAGPLVKKYNRMHDTMWERAMEMIKEYAGQETESK